MRKKQKGSILVFALIVLSFILVATFSLASVSLIERRSADISVNSSTAFQNSDKGMEEFLQQLYKELDQNDTLNDLADKLSGYSCFEPSGGGPARIGNENTEFIITAYKEKENTSDTTSGGWNSVEPIEDCDTPLADVSRFRATGNYNNAARAVFLKLRDSLSRGLVAHWSFEDRARNARFTDEDDEKTSFLAGDSSKQNHTLTLCELHSSDSDVDVNIINNEGDEETKKIEDFTECAHATDGMDEHKKGTCSYCDLNGAWVDGIVESDDNTVGVFGDNSRNEALEFDGDDYLAINFSSSCDSDVINCVDEGDNKLDLTDGIAVSAWVKTSNSADETILSHFEDNNKGYKLFIDSSGHPCLQLNSKKVCSKGSKTVNDDNWHHIVGTWRQTSDSDKDIRIFIDGENETESGNSVDFDGSIDDNVGDMLFIGASYDDDAGSMEEYFTGQIDDVRLWDRRLTDSEVMRLCEESVETDVEDHGDGTCDIP